MKASLSTMALPDSDTSPWPHFTGGQLELLKWIGVLSMFIDHFGRHLFGWGLESVVFGAGRLAFPLFALVLACNLARPGDRAARAKRVTLRLAIACAVATPAAIWARGDPALVNVFGTLGLGAALCWVFASRSGLLWRVAVCGLVATAAVHVEFGLAGVCLLAATYLWRARVRRETAALAAIALVALTYFNFSFGGAYGVVGTLAVVPLAWAVTHVPVVIPRMSWLFYAIYPAHLALIGALNATVVNHLSPTPEQPAPGARHSQRGLRLVRTRPAPLRCKGMHPK